MFVCVGLFLEACRGAAYVMLQQVRPSVCLPACLSCSNTFLSAMAEFTSTQTSVAMAPGSPVSSCKRPGGLTSPRHSRHARPATQNLKFRRRSPGRKAPAPAGPPGVRRPAGGRWAPAAAGPADRPAQTPTPTPQRQAPQIPADHQGRGQSQPSAQTAAGSGWIVAPTIPTEVRECQAAISSFSARGTPASPPPASWCRARSASFATWRAQWYPLQTQTSQWPINA